MFTLLPAGRYDVYANLQASAAFLKLNANGLYLLQLQAAFAKLQVGLSVANALLDASLA